MRNFNSAITVRIHAKHASPLIDTVRHGEIIRNACNCTVWDYLDAENRKHLWISLTVYHPYAMKKKASLEQKQETGTKR